MSKPSGQGCAALLRTDIGPGIGPLAQAGLDEAFGFAIGARGIRPGSQLAQAMMGAGLPEHPAAIAVAVVGHDPLDRNAVDGKPGERAFEKTGGGFLALVWQDFAVGEPAGVIDADVQALPADPVMPIDCAGAASGDAMANALDASELLGVDMDQLARTRP